jgi:Arc/MetJ-type ribon-helix-helix transcriptional regulator
MPPRLPKSPDSEKLTLNLGFIDLGQIELLVREGFYSNRSDFIRTAIRNQLERHADVLRAASIRRNAVFGLRHISRAELEEARGLGTMLDIEVLGLVVIASDVTEDLARATIANLSVLGALQASDAIKAALADRLN